MADISMPDNTASFMRAGQARLDATTARLRPETGTKLDEKALKRIDDAATDFEAVFLTEMIKPMFEGIEVNEMFGGGKGEEIFTDLMIEEYGKNMAEAGGIGIASFVREELIRQQEGTVK